LLPNKQLKQAKLKQAINPADKYTAYIKENNAFGEKERTINSKTD
jgi:hypothetical protein